MNIDITNIPVYYINLDSSTARRKSMEVTLSSNGFTNVTRISASTGHNSVNGCARSHHALLNSITYTGPFLVLEDDVEVTKDFIRSLQVPDNADAVYLGTGIAGRQRDVSTRRPIVRKENDDYYQLYNMLSAHAILYTNADYVKFLSKALNLAIEHNTHQDIVRAVSMKFFSVYAHNKPLFYQNDVESGNHWVTQTPISELPTLSPTASTLGLHCRCGKHKTT
jgi:GR25 family glycosyltransferase involved in LPS biosynthesis